MQHISLKAFQGVSKDFPVLVPADAGDIDDGPASFILPPIGMKQGLKERVHIVRNADFKRDWLQKSLSREDVHFVVGVTKLRDACRDGDMATARDAYSMLMPALQKIGVITDTGEYNPADFYSANMHWCRLHYQRLITHALEEVKVVWWWPTLADSTLAFYCPTWKSALIFTSLTDRFRMCPCGKLFIPTRKNRVCCCSEHSNYYRLKRWREKKLGGSAK